MNISNKVLLNIIYISLFITAIGLVGLVTGNPDLELLFNVGTTLFVFTGVYLLLKNGRFIKTNVYRFCGLAVSFIIIGAMLKIMHWPYAGQISAIGFFSFPLIYLVYMLKYKQTDMINFLKLLFLILISTGKYFQLIHWPDADLIVLAAVAILLILIVDAVKNKKVSV